MATDPNSPAIACSYGGYDYTGLTKRELFALVIAVQTKWAGTYFNADSAVIRADDLINALNKEPHNATSK